MAYTNTFFRLAEVIELAVARKTAEGNTESAKRLDALAAETYARGIKVWSDTFDKFETAYLAGFRFDQ